MVLDMPGYYNSLHGTPNSSSNFTKKAWSEVKLEDKFRCLVCWGDEILPLFCQGFCRNGNRKLIIMTKTPDVSWISLSFYWFVEVGKVSCKSWMCFFFRFWGDNFQLSNNNKHMGLPQQRCVAFGNFSNQTTTTGKKIGEISGCFVKTNGLAHKNHPTNRRFFWNPHSYGEVLLCLVFLASGHRNPSYPPWN